MIYFGAPDGFLVALDAKTGKVRWETKIDNGQITAGGILVADGKVLTNRTCPQGVREFCFIAAHDARTGKEVWRFYTTAAPGEPGGDTWADMPVEQRAAGPWGLPGSYDPKRKITYWGIANPNPYTRLTRHGSPDAISHSAPSNLYSNSTVALDIATGKLQLVLPGAAGRRLGCRSQSGTHPPAHYRQPRCPACEVARLRPAAQPGAGGRGVGRRGRRPVRASIGTRENSSGRIRSPTTIPTST